MDAPFESPRSVVTDRFALLTPGGFVPSPIPGWHGAKSCVVVVSPAIGAAFAQTLITLAPDQSGGGCHPNQEVFVFVVSGSADLSFGEGRATLERCGYAHLPPGMRYEVRARGTETQILLFTKVYEALPGVSAPPPTIGNELALPSIAFLGDEGAQLRALLPDAKSEYDMGINTFTIQPGVGFPVFENHVLEHGVLILEGHAIFRTGDRWNIVKAGDVLWIGPYCVAWLVAFGKIPTRFIYYKDVNRDPLGFAGRPA
jgi:(S)-ureidoglycine aminohydrolase